MCMILIKSLTTYCCIFYSLRNRYSRDDEHNDIYESRENKLYYAIYKLNCISYEIQIWINMFAINFSHCFVNLQTNVYIIPPFLDRESWFLRSIDIYTDNPSNLISRSSKNSVWVQVNNVSFIWERRSSKYRFVRFNQVKFWIKINDNLAETTKRTSKLSIFC